MRRLISMCLAVAVGMVAIAPSAWAGGAVWHFDRSYLPGNLVESTTSVAWSHDQSLGRPENGPFLIYLHPADANPPWPHGALDGLLVGVVEVKLGPFTAQDGELYGPNRATAVFEVPQVAPGEYQIMHCNDPCTTTLGDIIGGWDLVIEPGTGGRPADAVATDVRADLDAAEDTARTLRVRSLLELLTSLVRRIGIDTHWIRHLAL